MVLRQVTKKNFNISKMMEKQSKKAKKLSRTYLHKDQAAAQAYMAKAMDYKAQSLDAKYQAQNYLKLFKQMQSKLKSRPHDDDQKRDHDGRSGHRDDRDKD